MKGLGRVVGWTVVLLCIFWSNTYPSTGRVQTYASKAGMTNSPSAMSSRVLIVQNEDSTKKERADSIPGERTRPIKLKDPNMAIFYAIVPGTVVHGAGHFYAGRKATGWILFGGEVLSLGIFTYAVGSGFAEAMGGSNSNIDDDIAAILGGTLFLGTWIYDLFDAPLAVERHNRELLEKQKVGLKFDFDQTRGFARIQIAKRF
ncbi:MAG: hypothetical protein WCE90_06845 [Candidatus Zixiibacteriota bacterium]